MAPRLAGRSPSVAAMSQLADHVARWLLSRLAGLPPSRLERMQALSLWIWDIDDDARQATAELAVLPDAPATLRDGMVIDGGLGKLADPDDDPHGVVIREAWASDVGVWYEDDAGDHSMVWDQGQEEWTGGFIEAFVAEVTRALARLHASGRLRSAVGRDVLVVVHDGRDEAAARRWTTAANPGVEVP